MQAIHVLLKAGADVDSRNMYQCTPLHYACHWGHWQVMRCGPCVLCVACNVSPAEWEWTRNPLSHSLLRHPRTLRGCAAVARGVYAHVPLCLCSVTYLQRQSNLGSSQFNLTPVFVWVQAAEILLEAGADITALNECQWTALHHAMFAHSPAAAELLLARGIPPDMMNDDLDRPWDIAMRKERLGHVEVLERYHSTGIDGVAREKLDVADQDATDAGFSA